jgi:hypothetical protein
MSEFKITREMVQELAETGAVQLSGVETPMSHTRNQSDLNTALCKGLPLIMGLMNQILTLSGYDATRYRPPQISSAAESKDLNIKGAIVSGEDLSILLHQDFSADGGITGFSVLWTPFCPLREEEGLYVAGRSNVPREQDLRKIYYHRGPIVIAQRNFGMRLLGKKEGELNAVWHEGERRYPGGICIAELRYDEASMEFKRRYTNPT